MKTSTLVSVGLAAACLNGVVHAQTPSPSSPPMSQEDLQKRSAALASLAPLVSKTTEELVEAQLKIAERPETAERIATFKKNFFDALRRKGFTVEQAMQLTVATAVAPFANR